MRTKRRSFLYCHRKINRILLNRLYCINWLYIFFTKILSWKRKWLKIYSCFVYDPGCQRVPLHRKNYKQFKVLTFQAKHDPISFCHCYDLLIAVNIFLCGKKFFEYPGRFWTNSRPSTTDGSFEPSHIFPVQNLSSRYRCLCQPKLGSLEKFSNINNLSEFNAFRFKS